MREYTYVPQGSGIMYKRSHIVQSGATRESTQEAPTVEEMRRRSDTATCKTFYLENAYCFGYCNPPAPACQGHTAAEMGSSLLFSSCSLAVAVCNLLVVGPRNRADHLPALPYSGFLALPRPTKNQQAELQYYPVNNLIQEARLQYYQVNSSIQRS